MKPHYLSCVFVSSTTLFIDCDYRVLSVFVFHLCKVSQLVPVTRYDLVKRINLLLVKYFTSGNNFLNSIMIDSLYICLFFICHAQLFKICRYPEHQLIRMTDVVYEQRRLQDSFRRGSSGNSKPLGKFLICYSVFLCRLSRPLPVSSATKPYMMWTLNVLIRDLDGK